MSRADPDPATPAGEPRLGRTVGAARDATARARTLAKDQIVELGSEARRDDPLHWKGLIACVLAAVAAAIDPPILQATSSGVQGALRLEPEAAAQLVGSYYVIQAAVMVAGGVLGDRYGRRRVLLIGLAGMLVASLVVALASSIPMLVGGHVALMLFTAVVVPLSLAGVMGTFGQRVLPVAIAVYLAVQLTAALVAPSLAQLMFNMAGFWATFVPATVATFAALLAVRRWLPHTPLATRISGADAVALFLWSLGMLAVVYGLVSLAGGWGSLRELAIVVGLIALLGAFAQLGRRRGRFEMPNVPFRVIGVTLFGGAVLGIAQSGSLLQLSNFLKGVQGYGDLASGLALAPFAIATLIASVGTGVILSRRYHGQTLDLSLFRKPISLGLAVVALATLLLGLVTVDSTYVLIGTALGLLGTGAAIANVPRTDLLFQSVRRDRIGVAAGLNGSSVLLGEALGNVAVTAMIALSSNAALQTRLIADGLTAEQAVHVIEQASRAAFLAASHPFVKPSFLDLAVQIPGWSAAFTTGYGAAMVTFAGLAAVAAVVSWVALRAWRRESA